MELRQLRYFQTIVELNNLSRAAEKMCVAQSTLSHALRQLEEELGIALFDRVGRAMRLTQAGRVFYDYAVRTCNETMRAKRAMQELNELDAGTFTLGTIPVFPLSFLPPAVSSFNQMYPKVRIVVQDLLAAELEEKLALGTLDLGIAFHPASRSDVESEYLFSERLVLAVGWGHPFAQKRRVQWKTLGSIPLALLTPKFSTRILIEDAFRAASVQSQIVVEMDNTESLLAVAAEGQLATIVPENTGTRIECISLIPITHPELSRKLGLLWPKGAGRTRVATTFADMLKDVSANVRNDQKT
ncbi:LysR substrate-binding domain-containing protein [Burkholderia sp. BCC0419]|uniref:LysR substrate-binding domain-containing protein n=1 Tax=Burkholderia sp. BCC0419 TaxID=486878 RepID=UPI00158D6636|nr:LysR substrate-binding domain-containing protein [Burkholderia sp. BCC0419]